MDQNKLNQQSLQWDNSFFKKPTMFGSIPSKAAINALKTFKENNIDEIIELGPGLGRDTIFFAENKIKVKALDYSPRAIRIIKDKIHEKNISQFVSVKTFDVRKRLPYKDNSINGFFS